MSWKNACAPAWSAISNLGESEPHDMWDMVMRCVERPVLKWR